MNTPPAPPALRRQAKASVAAACAVLLACSAVWGPPLCLADASAPIGPATAPPPAQAVHPEEPHCTIDNVFDQARRHSLALGVIAAFCLLQAGLIAALLIQGKRHRFADAERRSSEAKYRFIVEWAHEGICMVDLEGHYTYLNRHMLQMFGLSAEEMLGKRPLEFIHPDDKDSFRANIERIRRGKRNHFESRFKGAPGHEGWILVSATPLMGAQGAVTGFFAVVHDLTARKRAEEAWKESEERYRALIQQAPEAILVYDVDSATFADANVNAQVLFGLSLAELRDTSLDTLYLPEQPDGLPLQESVAENSRRVLAGETLVLERMVIDRAGRTFPCEVRLSLLPTAGRRLIRGSFIDISTRKTAENALRESEKRFKSIYEQAADGIVVIGAQGLIQHANPAAIDLFGYSLDELKRLSYKQLLVPGQLESAPIDEDGLRAGRIVRAERQFLCKDGRTVHTDVSGRLVNDSLCQVIIKDVTTRKSLETLRDDVERILRHDLKTPLVCMQSLARMVSKEQGIPPRAVERLAMLDNSAERMLRMINMSFDLYKMETNTYEHAPVRFDLLCCVKTVMEQANATTDRKQLRLGVLLDGRPATPEDTFCIYGEEILCLAMLENLLQNAFEASPPGGRVTVALGQSPMRLEVRNQGEVPAHIRSTFFEKYVTSGKTWGTGLGTYSARLVAATHGWRIALDCDTPGETAVTINMDPTPSPPARVAT